jgi:non-specific serine/threonine protein kinase
VAQLQGDYERARQLHGESLSLFRRFNGAHNFGVAWAFQGLGETALALGDAMLAATQLAKALSLSRDLEDRAGIAWCLAGLAGVAVLDEEPEHGARLWGAAEALRQSIGARHAPAARATRERLMAAAREQLGDVAFDAEWAAGQALTIEQALALGLETTAGA